VFSCEYVVWASVSGVKYHQRNKTNNMENILLMLSIRFDNISVFVVGFKEFGEILNNKA
jgi:hypothetical protein